MACYEAALAAAPNFAIVQQNLAIALTELGTRAKLAGKLELPLTNRTCKHVLCSNPQSSPAHLLSSLLAAHVCAES